MTETGVADPHPDRSAVCSSPAIGRSEERPSVDGRCAGEGYPRSVRELEVWNGAIAAAAGALVRSAASVATRPLQEGQTLNRRRLTVELIEALGDEVLRLGMTVGDLAADLGSPGP